MVLPPWAEVTHAPLPPFWKSPSTDYDMVIIGTGHSVFEGTLTDELFAFLEKIPVCIGIFGTQYRDMINRQKLARLFENIDYWFARNADDIEFVGQAAATTKTTHLGDWLINAFPMAKWTKDQELYIPADFIKMRKDILTTTHEIQSYKVVNSYRLHPLLCALTSAEKVKFTDQREMGSTLKSGKFDSMLTDIFGRTFAEDVYFPVAKNDVVNYKVFTRTNTDAMKDIIWGICKKRAQVAL